MEKRMYCGYYDCWCSDVEDNMAEIGISEPCNFRCTKCSYCERKDISETYYTE